MHDSGVRKCTREMVYTIDLCTCIVKDTSSIRFFCLSYFKFILQKFKPTLYPPQHTSSFVLLNKTIKLLNASTSITTPSSTDLAYRKSGSFAQMN